MDKSINIKVPVLPESVTDARIATWHKAVGEYVKRDEPLVDIETDKVILEVVAPADGCLDNLLKQVGDNVQAEEIIAIYKETAQIPSPITQSNDHHKVVESLSPAVRRAVSEHNIDVSQRVGTGKKGRLTVEDVKPEQAASQVTQVPPAPPEGRLPDTQRNDRRVPMTKIRARIAERLVEAQKNAAILTTFNEVNMQPVMQLRQKYKDMFEKDYGVRLGFMSFFITAVVEALKRFPIVNASVEGNDIIYHDYYDIGVAVSSPRGLVVPVIRNADECDMAQIEKQITAFSDKAKNGQLTLAEMTGGTFTLSNGGVFGSLMSTPILNPPQSAILGLHRIEERPIAENNQVVIRPMMYTALSYDHRIIDGSDSVRFLVTIKELLEDPARLLLNV